MDVWKGIGKAIAYGRDMDEQVATVRKYGNYGAAPLLRAGLFAALGISKPEKGLKTVSSSVVTGPSAHRFWCAIT